MNPYYPVLVNLERKRCLVIGNGWAAAERVRGLLNVGAEVTLVAREAAPEVARLADEGRLHWIRREYAPGDMEGFFLVISAPADRGDNLCISEEARRRGALFNAVDDPAHCNFIFPAIHRQGDLIVSVSTSGKSPAVASRLRDRFAAELGPEYGRFLALLGDLREEIATLYPKFEARRKVYYELVDSEALQLIRDGDPDGAARVLRLILDRAGVAGGGA